MAIETTQAIVDRIVAQGIAVATGASTGVFHSRLPAQPDNAIAVRLLSGAKADRAFGESTAPIREYPDVQLLLRRTTIDSMTTLIDALRTAFDFKKWTASGGNEFFTQFSYEPVDLGEDENEREMRSIVLDVKRER